MSGSTLSPTPTPIVAPSPVLSLGLRLQVTSGRNQILRNVGEYNAFYLTSGNRNVSDSMELAPGESYQSNPAETTNNLIVSTNAQLTFAATRVAGGNLNLNVNNLLVVDDALSKYSITNNGTSIAVVNVNAVNVNSTVPVDPVYYGAAIPGSVIDAAFVQALANVVNEAKNQTVTMTANTGEFLFYCYPKIFGESVFNVNGNTSVMAISAVVTIDTTRGPTQYYVYESNSSGLGPVTMTVTDA